MTYGGGAPDRGGGRESKKASLRKNKKGLAEAAKTAGKPVGDRPAHSLRPQRLAASGHACAIIDCGAQLLNRQFDRDQLKVLQRSAQAGAHGSTQARL